MRNPSKYRVHPWGPDLWVIQDKFLFWWFPTLFLEDATDSTYYQYRTRGVMTFGTKEEGEQWLRDYFKENT